jgi:hypothetical protein
LKFGANVVYTYYPPELSLAVYYNTQAEIDLTAFATTFGKISLMFLIIGILGRSANEQWLLAHEYSGGAIILIQRNSSIAIIPGGEL